MTVYDKFTVLDVAAVLWFVSSWNFYAYYADHSTAGRASLTRILIRYRLAWMREMLRRPMRMQDMMLIGNLMHSVTFFASTTIFIIGSLIAVMAAGDKATALINEVRIVVPTTKLMWEVKVLLLVVIFVYAFFRLSWSIRQWNYCSVMLGGAPPPETAPEELESFARRGAHVTAYASSHFNGGLRGYYFGMAALSWFLGPWPFMAATVWVLIVLYRREFRSRSARALGPVDPKDVPELPPYLG